MTEGRTARYGVVLQSQPQNNVVITAASSDASVVRVSPASLTFTTENWNVVQDVTLTAQPDADGMNETATITYEASGDIYDDDVPIADVSVTVIEDGTAVRDTSSFLRSSSCDGAVILTWNAPVASESSIASFKIEWRLADEQYSDERSIDITDGNAKSHTLSLANGMYTIRVLGLGVDMDSDGNLDPLWSREVTATPSKQACITSLGFGNILADSTPVIVEIEDPEPGTTVNMRYRSLNPGVWSEVQSQTLDEGDTSVTFEIRGLKASSNYEVQTWLGARTPPENQPEASASVAQAVFRTGDLPPGATSFGGGGSTSGRILRIEPGITAVTVSPGDRVLLSVEVWGRQDLLDNGLSDKDPADGRPVFNWGPTEAARSARLG